MKPLDDALSQMNVTYLRFQDDILILCKTKRQMQRARRRMMEVLHERRLTLSRKKSKMGSIADSFHFLGIHYSPTQTVWDFQTLVEQFINICWHDAPVIVATDVLSSYLTGLDTRANSCGSTRAA